MTDGHTDHIRRLSLVRLAGVGSDLNGVVESYYIQVVDLVGNKKCAKKRTARAHPVKSSVEGVAAGNLLGGDVFRVVVDLIFELARGIRRKIRLVAEPSRPCRKRIHGSAI